MKAAHWLCFLVLASPMILSGCKDAPVDKPKVAGTGQPEASKAPPADKVDEAEIRANLAKLSPEDRSLAEAQKFCVVEQENRLGVMGVPFKVMVNDQPVFLCCKGCRKKALAELDQTLAKVKELKAKTGAAPAP